MEINWKVVAPIALVIGVIVLYFVRVKPLEGFGSKVYSNGKYFDEQEENVSYNCNA